MDSWTDGRTVGWLPALACSQQPVVCLFTHSFIKFTPSATRLYLKRKSTNTTMTTTKKTPAGGNNRPRDTMLCVSLSSAAGPQHHHHRHRKRSSTYKTLNHLSCFLFKNRKEIVFYVFTFFNLNFFLRHIIPTTRRASSSRGRGCRLSWLFNVSLSLCGVVTFHHSGSLTSSLGGLYYSWLAGWCNERGVCT